MDFKLWESTFNDLYASAVEAFPETKKRQHATGPVHVGRFMWTPFVGLKTFLVRGQATNEDRQYNTLILFRNVVYRNGPGEGVIKLKISTNESRYIERLTPDNHNILVRCDCPDFYWRFNFWDHRDKSLYGNKRAKYESKGGPPANPRELPGCCKHLMKMFSTLQGVGLITS